LASRMSEKPIIGMIAGKGIYPEIFLRAARREEAGVKIVVAGFHGETFESLVDEADEFDWFKVGHLGKVIKFFLKHGVNRCIMVGQISPRNLFDLVPDFRTMKMLARLKKKNADTLFKAVAEELERDGIEVIKATTYLDEFMATEGHICGPKLKDRFESDVSYGFSIAKETSRLDIGQSVVVKDGTVLAVEAFEGTDACIRRGGEQGKGKGCVLVKVSKNNHDFRFDVPCLGVNTIETCASSGISVIACEAGNTLILGKDEVVKTCQKLGISIVGVK
jgi:UDP-2,3-diacylglucosamine hydrolase